MLATARRYPAGSLPDPGASGALSATVCRLSGLRPGPAGPLTREWFAPNRVPSDTCGWHDGRGGVELPAEYAEWAERSEIPPPTRAAPAGESVRGPFPGFRIRAPREGDVYRLSPGVEARYATVALRAVGARGGDDRIRWTVDDRPHPPGRWSLRPGLHRFRAVTMSGDSAEVTVRVE